MKSFFFANIFVFSLLSILVIAALIAIPLEAGLPGAITDLDFPMVILLTLVGFIAGLLGGWIGTGGCSIMLPVLHFWLGFPAQIAIGTTLFAVIFTAVSGGYAHFIRKNLDRRVTIWTGIAGIIGVIIGSLLFTIFSKKSDLLGIVIGVVFLWPSFRMIWEGVKGYKPKGNHPKAEVFPQEQSIKGHPFFLSIFGIMVGTLTGLVGLGGGYALVPGLIYLFGAPVYITMGTSLAIMAPMALVGGTIKLAQGFVFLSAALILAFGTIIGSQIGASTIKKFRPNTLKLIFGIYFLYVALKFIFNYFGIRIW